MGYNELLWDMWFNLWGNTLIGCIVLLGFFGFMCFKKHLGVGGSAMVIFPVLFGVVSNNFVPIWVQGMFLVALGFLWALAILKLMGLKYS